MNLKNRKNQPEESSESSGMKLSLPGYLRPFLASGFILIVIVSIHTLSPEAESPAIPSRQMAESLSINSIRFKHPRILFGPANPLKKLQERFQTDKGYAVKVAHSNKNHIKWILSRDRKAGLKAIETLASRETVLPGPSYYGNGLAMALAWDNLWNHPDFDHGLKKEVQNNLKRYLIKMLSLLDADSPSLWHGRFQKACTAWVVAASMDPVDPEVPMLIKRSLIHFYDALEAIELTQGWPEGYSYWINNRAYTFAIACLAHINAVDDPQINRRIRDIVKNTCLWMIYGTEPTGRFTLFGDTGSRNDLKDETQRVVDIFSLITGEKSFKIYSRYLSGLHGEASYYAGYRWGIPVFRGYDKNAFKPGYAIDTLDQLETLLPKSRIFGRESFGQVFLRSGWSPEDTFISYRSGHTFAHHGHYMAGHFTITKNAPLAITSGTYGEYASPHRLNYYIRTVASNSLLILRPGETVKPNRFFNYNSASGGQRVVLPTGSTIRDVSSWKNNLGRGKHMEGGKITGFYNRDKRFVYIESDLTGAYNNSDYDENRSGGKVSLVRRHLLYLPLEGLIVNYDSVTPVRPEYTVKWLLHSWNKPETNHETLLVGSPGNGIMQSRDRSAVVKKSGSTLKIDIHHPESLIMRKIGGEDYRYYVETDGDDSSLNGINMSRGAREKPWYDSGMWRIELQRETPEACSDFLITMKPGYLAEDKQIPMRPIKTGGFTGLETERNVVLFKKDKNGFQEFSYTIKESGGKLHIISGMFPSRDYIITCGGEKRTETANEEGILVFNLNALSRNIHVKGA